MAGVSTNGWTRTRVDRDEAKLVANAGTAQGRSRVPRHQLGPSGQVGFGHPPSQLGHRGDRWMLPPVDARGVLAQLAFSGRLPSWPDLPAVAIVIRGRRIRRACDP